LKDIVLKPISSSMSRTRSLARVVPRGSALPVCGNCWVCKTRWLLPQTTSCFIFRESRHRRAPGLQTDLRINMEAGSLSCGLRPNQPCKKRITRDFVSRSLQRLRWILAVTHLLRQAWCQVEPDFIARPFCFVCNKMSFGRRCRHGLHSGMRSPIGYRREPRGSPRKIYSSKRSLSGSSLSGGARERQSIRRRVAKKTRLDCSAWGRLAETEDLRSKEKQVTCLSSTMRFFRRWIRAITPESTPKWSRHWLVSWVQTNRHGKSVLRWWWRSRECNVESD